MRVKLCARCPYTPRDLTGHYDPEAALHVCAKCDGEHGGSTQHYPRKAYRRRACSTAPNIFGMARTALCSKKCADRFKTRQQDDRRWLRRLQAVSA